MAVKIKWIRTLPWLKNLITQGNYHSLTVDELRGTRNSDTVFLFGSGYSLNGIAEDEYRKMEAHDIMGFNWFIRQRFLRVDYHMIREIWPILPDKQEWLNRIRSSAELIENNPCMTETVLIVQQGWTATDGNEMIGRKLLSPHRRIFRFHNSVRGISPVPSESFDTGLVHGSGTLIDCLNFAYILGWQNIVFVGVDLYDRRYFWLNENETRIGDELRGNTYIDKHNTADRVIEQIAKWMPEFAQDNINLYVYNPKSLLKSVVPVFDWKYLD